MLLTEAIDKAKKIAPQLSGSQVVAIFKLVCAVSVPLCSVVNGMMFARSDRRFYRVTASGIYPEAILTAYNIPKVSPSILAKRTVFIPEFGGQFSPSDIYAYCEKRGLPVPRLTIINNQKMSKSDADGEVGLDISVIAAIAQGCHIVIDFEDNTEQGFVQAVQTALEMNVDAVSLSWGAPEDQWTVGTRNALDGLFKQCWEHGIGVYVAAGDNGSSDGELTGNHVDYPASSPYVVACGGTKLELNPDGTRASETAWTPGLLGQDGSTGGGISAIYDKTPTWQNAAFNQSPQGRRVPDVAGNADPTSGFLVMIDGREQQVGGTSAVAPMYAAFQAIFNAIENGHVGRLPQRFYENPSAFLDVTQGDNGAFRAGPGFDCVTGLGVIDGQKFLATIGSPPQS